MRHSALVRTCLAALLISSVSTPLPAAEAPVNASLAGLERLARIGRNGPETIEIGPTDGRLYTGYDNGQIFSFAPDGTDARLVADTGGRPLGLHPMHDGTLIVADAERGLLKVTLAGVTTVLAADYQGDPFKFIDDLAIAPDEATIYFTEASHKYDLAHYTWDILEHSAQGRLFRYDVATGKVTFLLGGINFANGIILAPSGDSLLIDESGSYRVLRYWLAGPKQGTAEPFAANLPGYPDNITYNGKDRIWVALAMPREPLLDQLLRRWPQLVTLIRLIPQPLLTPPELRTSLAVGLDLDGNVVTTLHYQGANAYAPVTTVREVPGWLYFGSLTKDAIGRMPWSGEGER